MIQRVIDLDITQTNLRAHLFEQYSVRGTETTSRSSHVRETIKQTERKFEKDFRATSECTVAPPHVTRGKLLCRAVGPAEIFIIENVGCFNTYIIFLM